LRNIIDEQANCSLVAVEEKWGHKYKYTIKQRNENGEELMLFLDFPEGMHEMIYTTNPAEALHRIIRRRIKSKGAGVSETALTK